MTTPTPEPGWYPDPEDESRLRYWDGAAWTDRSGERAAGAVGMAESERTGRSQIFINYRRQDSQYAAGRIGDRLVSHFGEDRVFIDVETIQPGFDFLEVIEQVIGESAVMVAIIGPEWAELSDAHGQPRLQDPEDPVRLELELALRRGLRVLPVLVDGATMPSAAQLPEGLESLSRRHAVTVAHERFRQDANELIEAIEAVVGPPADESEQAAESAAAGTGEKPIGRVLAALGETARRTSEPESGGLGRTLSLLSTATIAAAISAAVMFALALIVSIQTGEESLLDLSGGSAGTIKEAFNQVSAFTLGTMRASIDGATVDLRVTPAIFGLLLMVVCALSSFLVAGRSSDVPGRTRLFWSAATGVPLAMIMAAFAVLAGTTEVTSGGAGIGAFFDRGGDPDEVVGSFEPAPGWVFVLSSLWGSLGGLIGTRAALRREGKLGALSGLKWAPGINGMVWATWRSLGLLLVFCALAGTAVWSVQTVRDVGGIGTEDERGTGVVAAERGLFVADHAVNYAALGSLSSFHDPSTFGVLGMPAPVTKVGEVLDEAGQDDDRAERAEDRSFSLLSYRSALPATLFVPSLGLVLVVLLFAADGGFSLARNRAVGRLEQGAAWGALVGPLWAIPMLVLNALFLKELMGEPDGGSVFVTFLVIGGVGGMLGGALAGARQPSADRA